MINDLNEAELAETIEGSACPYCGRGPLRRFEALNGRCERCRTRYLEAAGRPESPCEECEGRGWIRLDDGTYGRCACRFGEDTLDNALRRVGVPPRYLHFRLEAWRGEVPTEAEAYIEDPTGTLFIHGLQGRGKTHLSVAILARVLKGGRVRSAAWRDCLEMISALRSAIRLGDQPRYDLELERLRSVDLLVLDDLGRERPTDYAIDEIDGLIRRRHMDERAMIVTSNWSLRGLVTPEAEGGRGLRPDVASRLRGREIHLTGKDGRSQ